MKKLFQPVFFSLVNAFSQCFNEHVSVDQVPKKENIKRGRKPGRKSSGVRADMKVKLGKLLYNI